MGLAIGWVIGGGGTTINIICTISRLIKGWFISIAMLLSKNKVTPLPMSGNNLEKWKSQAANTKVFGHHLINFFYSNNGTIFKFAIHMHYA